MTASLKLIDGDKKTGTMERQKALEAALAQIDRAFGKGSAMRLGSKETMQVEVISTGSLGLDIALGVGGLPRGRVIEIYGPESSGKTTLALHVIAEAQRGGGTAAFIDAEHALDPVYAKKLGVNIDELIVSQPDTGEQALEIVDTLVRSNAIDVLVVDSVAALVPRAEIEGEMGDSHVGLQARLMSQSLRKLTGSISRSRCMVIFINQLRMKIGVMYGNPGDDDRRQCAQILRLGPPRHPSHRPDQGSRGDRRQHHPGEGRQEQGRAAVQAGRVRHHVWRGHFQDRRDSRPRRQGRAGREIGRLVLL
jgi:recombination protein RecA